MWRIFTRQLHDNLRSLRFQLGLLVLLLFFSINGFVYSWKMEQQVEEDARIQADVERVYEEVETVADLAAQRFKVLARPLGTEFISEAGFNWFHDAMWVSSWWSTGGGGSLRLESLRTTNNWMRRFELLDWTVIVRYVLSFLCVVLAYNAVSGEMESGTLRMVLSNPVSRASFLGGKLLAHLVTLLSSMAVGCLISLLILSLHGVLELDARIARSGALFLAGATLYATLFLLVGTGISVLTRSSASSLVFLVTAWTLLVVVVPQTSYLVATRAVGSMAVGSMGVLGQRLYQYEQQVREGLIREGLLPRDPQTARTDGYALEQRFVARLEEVVREGDRIIQEAYRQNRLQYMVARAVNLISPGYAFQYAVEGVLGAGLERFERFHAQGWRYRDVLRTFLQERDAADPDSPHLPLIAGFTSRMPLDSAEIPRFEQPELSLAESLETATSSIVILILETGVAFLFAAVAFQRAEVGG